MFKVSPDASSSTKFATNIASGGFAGSMSLSVVYSLDFARTRLANDSKCKSGPQSLISIDYKDEILQSRVVEDRLLEFRFLHDC